jgi:hypothetical protein
MGTYQNMNHGGIISRELIHEKICGHSEMEFGLVIFWNRRINFLSLSKNNIAKMKYCSNNSENSFLRERERMSKDSVCYFFVIKQFKHSFEKAEPVPFHLCQQCPWLSLWQDNHVHHLHQPVHSNLTG